MKKLAIESQRTEEQLAQLSAQTNDAESSQSAILRMSGNSVKLTALALALCFLTATFLCWRTNFSHAALDVASMFDSGKYVSSTEMVMNATTFIHHYTRDEWHTICGALREPLMMDGPILPLIGAAWFTLIQKSPDLFDMRAALTLQALLHGVSACCMFIAARRILNNFRWSLFAGLAWAAYPSAVLGAGRYMTENITATLLLAMVCLVPKQLNQRCIRSVALGVIAASVGLLKAALLPGILLGFVVVAASLWKNSLSTQRLTAKRLILHAISIGFGAALVLAPWLLFTKEATGTYSVTAQREPVLNIVIGGNAETDGWSGNPETDFVKLFDTVNDDKAGTFLGIWKANWPKLANIGIRRITRLWSSPWNDCLSKFMGLSLQAQWIYHQAIIFSAILGILLLLFKKSDLNGRFTNPILCMGGTILVAHLTYLVFNSSPRQAFTSMPLIVLLGCCALFQLSRAKEKYKAIILSIAAWVLWMVAVTVDLHPVLQSVGAEPYSEVYSWLVYVLSALLASCAIVFVTNRKQMLLPLLLLQTVPAAMISSAQAVAPAAVHEWQCELKPGLKANRVVNLNNTSVPDWALIIVDGDYGVTNAAVEINGAKLPEPLAPLSTLSSNKTVMMNYSVFGGVSNKNPEQLRRWRAAVIPLSYLHPGKNKISISVPNGSATIYGAFNRTEDGKLIAPTLWGFSGCKLLSETQPKLDARYLEPLTAAAASGVSSLTRNDSESLLDLSPDLGTQAGHYRAFIGLGFDKTKHTALSKQPPMSQELESSPILIAETKPFVKRYRVPRENIGADSFVNISLTGSFSGDQNVHVLSRVDVRNMSSLGSDVCIPGSNQLIQQKAFALSGDLTTSSLNQPDEFFEVKLQSNHPITLNNLSLKLTPCERPDFSKAKVSIY